MEKNYSISHDRNDEKPEAKARWFASLPMAERMQIFCDVTDLALSVNPSLMEKDHVKPVAGRIQILSAT
ncbi:MAG: hypothetical protein GX811_13760 [Lentisphaerae bacterium]|nr:hypothetical protein [Lentisphaerota bacterium]